MGGKLVLVHNAVNLHRITRIKERNVASIGKQIHIVDGVPVAVRCNQYCDADINQDTQFSHLSNLWKFTTASGLRLTKSAKPPYGMRQLDLALVTKSNIEQSRRSKGYL